MPRTAAPALGKSSRSGGLVGVQKAISPIPTWFRRSGQSPHDVSLASLLKTQEHKEQCKQAPHPAPGLPGAGRQGPPAADTTQSPPLHEHPPTPGAAETRALREEPSRGTEGPPGPPRTVGPSGWGREEKSLLLPGKAGGRKQRRRPRTPARGPDSPSSRLAQSQAGDGVHARLFRLLTVPFFPSTDFSDCIHSAFPEADGEERSEGRKPESGRRQPGWGGGGASGW